jgi:elongation factor P
MPATQIRRGMVLVFEGQPVRVIEFRHHTPGNLRAMVQAKLKNVRTGSTFEHRFRAADSVERASMETHDLEFLYQGGDTYHFMNTENYDQLEMDEEALGDNAQWMQPGMRIQAEYYDGRPIGIQLPNSLTLEIVETAPVMKSATKTASTKPAKLENGVTVNVPEFVGTGEKIRVNPQTGEYMDRAK